MSSGKKNGRSFRLARSAMEQEDAMENAVPCCTRYKNKWAVVVLKEWQFYRAQKRQAIDESKSMRLNKVLTHLLKQ